MTDTTPPRTRKWAGVGLYAGNALAACVILTFVLQLWRMDWRMPLYFSGDVLFTSSGIKALIDHGWFWFNPSIGAPGIANRLDYPAVDTFHWLVLKALSLVTRDWAATINAFYLLGYPAVSVAALWSFRRLGVSTPSAFAMSLLYAFLPYHLMRSEAHLFLGAYYTIPLVLVVCVELFGPAPPLVSGFDVEKLRLDLRSKSSWFVLGLCVLVGSSGVYYAYFGCFFIALAAALGWWQRGERVRLAVGAVLIGVIVAAVLVNVAPYAWYRVQAGPNPAGVERDIAGGEIYSLRPALLVLPVREHRIGGLAYVNKGYLHLLDSVSRDLVNETTFATLGVVGTVGLIFLLLVLIMGFRANQPRAPGAARLSGVASLTGAAILLASAGGFGTIVGVVLPQIRAYNRIVVFVAFLALFASGLLLDRLIGMFSARTRTWAAPLVVALVVIVGVLDMTTPAMIPRYENTKATWDANGAFVSAVEEGLPEGAKVLQLPFVKFPESGSTKKMFDYDHFRPYLQSSRIHWSYGAMKGRADSEWAKRISSLPAEQLVAESRAAGFAGIWIDTQGYADRGRSMSAQLASATGSSPRRSEDGRYLFFVIQ